MEKKLERKIHEFESCEEFYETQRQKNKNSSIHIYPPVGDIVILGVQVNLNSKGYELSISGEKCYGIFWYKEDAKKVARLVQKGEL